MNLWKKIIICMGFGIFTLSASGASGNYYEGTYYSSIYSHPLVLGEFARIIENSFESVSKVINLS